LKKSAHKDCPEASHGDKPLDTSAVNVLLFGKRAEPASDSYKEKQGPFEPVHSQKCP